MSPTMKDQQEHWTKLLSVAIGDVDLTNHPRIDIN